MGAFIAHVVLKLPIMVRSLRQRRLRTELRTPLEKTLPEPPDDHGLVAPEPNRPTMSRRGALGLIAGSSLVLLVLTAGQSVGGRLRRLAFFAPRGGNYGRGPNDFPVNKTAAAVGVGREETGPGWRLVVEGREGIRELSRQDLLGMTQHTYDLPIACVEGWSVTARWTGVRLADLAALVNSAGASTLLVESLQREGDFRRATLSGRQLRDPRSLLALRVNGADLSLDHGYPARVIVPAAPGVHNTKWVRQLTFGDGPE